MKAWIIFVFVCLLGEVGLAQKIKSDLEVNNLKGQVDSIVTEQLALDTVKGVLTKRPVSGKTETYNRQGNLMWTLNYSLLATDTGAMKTTYQYDGKQRLVSQMRYYRNGTPWQKFIYKYSGNEVDERRYDYKDNLLLLVVNVKYDEAGNKIEVVLYDNHLKKMMSIGYKYSMGNVISEEHFGIDGRLSYTITMGYNALDNKISDTRTEHDGSKSTKIYHYFNYDKQYNWLSMDETDKTGWITERKITYYE